MVARPRAERHYRICRVLTESCHVGNECNRAIEFAFAKKIGYVGIPLCTLRRTLEPMKNASCWNTLQTPARRRVPGLRCGGMNVYVFKFAFAAAEHERVIRAWVRTKRPDVNVIVRYYLDGLFGTYS